MQSCTSMCSVCRRWSPHKRGVVPVTGGHLGLSSGAIHLPTHRSLSCSCDMFTKSLRRSLTPQVSRARSLDAASKPCAFYCQCQQQSGVKTRLLLCRQRAEWFLCVDTVKCLVVTRGRLIVWASEGWDFCCCKTLCGAFIVGALT